MSKSREDGSVKLNVDSALKLAYVHSPSHQTQLETLYLSALDVTAERFRLDTQFFGGYDARYTHHGSLIPPALRYDPVLGRFVVNPAIDGDGVENNRLTLGRPFAADPALQARRRFATAGELLVGFANSFVFEFTGSDANLAASLANFSFIQPLLRGAGKDIALEQLTFVERALLADLRAYHQYRQGFYTQVAIGELGVTGPRRGGGGTNLSVIFRAGLRRRLCRPAAAAPTDPQHRGQSQSSTPDFGPAGSAPGGRRDRPGASRPVSAEC